MRIQFIFSCVLALAVVACVDDSEAPGKAPGIGEVVVHEAGPHVAQCAAIAITPRQSAAKLTSAGIDVRRTSCGYIEGVFYPAVCGAGTGEILLHDIPVESLAAAEAAGFASVDTLPGWRRETCAPYLHAIWVAQQPSHCADIRNRVLHIEDTRHAQRSVSLLDQAGNCADASYRQILFGGEGDTELCSIMETIAGPQKSCPVPEHAKLFDTILENLDLPDLGLGSGYRVTQVYSVD